MATPEEIQRKISEPVGRNAKTRFGGFNSSSTQSVKTNEPFSLDKLSHKARGFLWWVNVPRKTILVIEDRIGKKAVKTKKTGIRFAYPFFQKKTVVELSMFSITYSINDHEGAVTKDGIDVHGMTRINYEIDVEYIKNYYDQQFSNEQVEKESIAILKELISCYEWDKLKKKEIREINKESKIYNSVQKLAENYGIKIKSIDTTGMQAPQEIQDLEERKRAAQNEYQIKIGQATADYKIKQIQNAAKEAEGLTEAKIEDLKGTIRAQNVNKLIDVLFAQNFDAQQALEYLKRVSTNQNSVIIEGNGNSIDPQTILLAMNKLQNIAQNQQTNDFGNNSLRHK